MAKEFDPAPLLETLPSFYRDYLASADKDLLANVWESLTRVVDAEYAKAIQLASANKVARSAKTTLYPWVRQEFDWESQQVQHQHVQLEATSADDITFYLGRYIDPVGAEFFYNGVRVTITTQDEVTHELDEFQRAGSKAVGTRVVFGTAVASAGTLSVYADRELFVGTGTTDGVSWLIPSTWYDGAGDVATNVDSDFWSVILTHQDISASVVTPPTGNGTDTITIDRSSGFLPGQVVEVFTVSGIKSQQTVAAATTSLVFSFSGAETFSSATLVLNVNASDGIAAISSTTIDFTFSLPVGALVRVVDPSGTQAYSITDPSMTVTLDSDIDPTVASVFIYGFDLTATVKTSEDFSFGRAPTADLLYRATAPLVLTHDHARYTETVSGTPSTITLPATRPMALASGPALDVRYPVRVYVNGTLQAFAAYALTDTVTITFTAPLSDSDVVDVIYADAEEPAAHKHIRTETVVPSGHTLSFVDLGDTIDAVLYPVVLSYTGIGDVDPRTTSVDGSVTLILSTPVTPGSTITAYTEAAVFKYNYLYEMGSRSDLSESYLGTLVTADLLQDGINTPVTTMLLGSGLAIARSGDTTTIEASTAIPVGWFSNALVDEHLVSGILGDAVGLSDPGETTDAYVDAVTALYAAYYKGSQVDTVEALACVILGSSYTEEAGVSQGTSVLGTGVRQLNVLGDSGSSVALTLHDDIADRTVPAKVPRFFATSAHCVVTDKDLSTLPYLAFMAESVSATYRYAKRLDVTEPYSFSSVPSSYDSVTHRLTDLTLNFGDLEVRKGDLILLSTAEVTSSGITLAATSTYLHVSNVISNTVIEVDATLPSGTYGFGGTSTQTGTTYGWGDEGFGGVVNNAPITGYTIWTRRTRELDTHRYIDEMLDVTQAWASGEAVQKVNAVLAELLNRFMFAIRIDWRAQVDSERLGYLKHFLDTAKAAETGYFAYTIVENEDGIQDTVTGSFTESSVTTTSPLRETYIGQDFIESYFVSL